MLLNNTMDNCDTIKAYDNYLNNNTVFLFRYPHYDPL